MSTSTSERILVLLRHAKAADPVGVVDLQRPLTERGQADAAAAGTWLAEQGHAPDLVLCSPARRTKETWHQVAQGLSPAPQVTYAEEIYSGGPWELLELLRLVPAETLEVLVVGHNPTLELLAALLDPESGGRMRTAALSVHRQQGDWSDLGARTAPVISAHVARG